MNYVGNNQQLVRKESFFGVGRQKQTYLNLLYLLSAFPLGITYFILLITGLSRWGGHPHHLDRHSHPLVDHHHVAGLRQFRARAGQKLAAYPHPLYEDPRLAGMSWTRQFLARLRSPVTWTSLVYLFLEFPFGILSFTLVIGLLSASISLLFGWLAYLIDTHDLQRRGRRLQLL